jgi:homoserine O-acetyltransferase
LLGFDTRPDFARIKAKVLYVLCRTDALFPPKIAPDVIKALTAAGVEARYFELDSERRVAVLSTCRGTAPPRSA